MTDQPHGYTSASAGDDEEPLATVDHATYSAPSTEPVPQLTLEQVLEMAETPERTARICIKPKIDDDIEQVSRELATLVDTDGRLLENDEERGLDAISSAARAQDLEDQRRALTRQREAAMWTVRFRGKSADDMALFNRQHYPKPDKQNMVDLTAYNNRLIAETAFDPEISMTQVIALRGKLGTRAFNELAFSAQAVCTAGGVDVPK